MRKLHQLLIKTFLGPFILTFFIVLFLLLMQFIWKYVDDLVGKGLEWHIIAELLFYTSASLVPMALPLAMLLSSIMTLGNLGENNELVAVKSSGISLITTMKPLMVVAFIISIIAFYFANNILPIANLKSGALLWDVRQHKPALNIKEGVFYNGIEGYSIKVDSKDKKRNFLYGVMIYDHTLKNGNRKLITADSGKMEITNNQMDMILTLYQGKSYDEPRDEKNTNPLLRNSFSKEKIVFDLSGFKLERTDEELFKTNYKMLTIQQLRNEKDSVRKKMKEKNESFQKNIKKNYYTNYYHPKDSIPKVISDSATSSPNKSSFPESLNTASLVPVLDSLSKADQIKLLQTAANIARSTKAYSGTIKDDLKYKHSQLLESDIEIYRKFSLALACFILFFVGAPLGAIIRKGGLGLPVVVSVIIFVIYHIISITGEKMVEKGVLDAAVGMWMASALILPLGLLLTYAANKDSKIFTPQNVLTFFRRYGKMVPGGQHIINDALKDINEDSAAKQ